MKRIINICIVVEEQRLQEALDVAYADNDLEGVEFIRGAHKSFPAIVNIDSVTVDGKPVRKDDSNPVEDSYIINKPEDPNVGMFLHIAAYFE